MGYPIFRRNRTAAAISCGARAPRAAAGLVAGAPCTAALATALLVAITAGPVAVAAADPVRPIERPRAGVVCEAVWHDASRDRDVPLRIRIPQGAGPVPLILFSHGLGGSVEAGTKWAEAWSANGMAVIHLQHPGSDRTLLENETGVAERLRALRSAISASQLVARVADVRFVLDELTSRPREGDCDLGRLDLDAVGMSGHSFGAHTTQAIAGQSFPGGRTLRDPRIRAALAFSPAPPRDGGNTNEAAFASIGLPFFSITGTEDRVPLVNDVTPQQREQPYRSMPAGEKYLLVLEGADHAAFSGAGRFEGAAGRRPLRRGRRGTRTQPIDHIEGVVIAATVAYWKAMLRDDRAALAFLMDGGLQGLLREGDRFETK